MPKQVCAEEFKLQTRDKFTSVDCKMSIEIDGRELPNLGIIGTALEAAILQLQVSVTEAYTKVPERV